MEMKETMIPPTQKDEPVRRFLSETACNELANRAKGMAVGGGDMTLEINSHWQGNIRFAKNDIISGGDYRNTNVTINRDILGARTFVSFNRIDDSSLQAGVRRSERLLRNEAFSGGRQFRTHYKGLDSLGLAGDKTSKTTPGDVDAVSALIQTIEPFSRPQVFFDSTYNLQAPERLKAVEPLLKTARAENLSAAGFIMGSAEGLAVIDTVGRSLYYPYTRAQYTITVRTPDGTGSGWAGVNFRDWDRIDSEKITRIALDKCVRSKNPVAVEPGRYTAILEPQAVSDIFSTVMNNDRVQAELGSGPWALEDGETKIGLKVFDERITVSADPMDPDIGFPPFDNHGDVYHPVNWIEKGVLKELSYDRRYGINSLGINKGLPNSGSYRMSGGNDSLEDMIKSTKRGIVVTRFSNMRLVDYNSLLMSGYTRDGLWLVENGKVTRAIKNFRVLESPLFIFNNLETLGAPQQVFSNYSSVVVPPAKVRDFSFTALIEAI